MKKCIKKVLLVVCVVAMPITTHAVLIDHGTGYTRDSASNVVHGGGLEWLQWSETVGQSINTALGTYASDGWRLASNTEMAGLFNAFNFGQTFSALEGSSQSASTSWNSAEAGPHIDFIELFVRTWLLSREIYDPTDPREGSSALFGSGDLANERYNVAEVSDDYTVLLDGGDPQSAIAYDASANIYAQVYGSDFSLHRYGVALVKSVSVPEPGTFALLSLGLLGLGLNRRIHRKTL